MSGTSRSETALDSPDADEHPDAIGLSSPLTRLLGAHMPTAGGLSKSLLSGREIGCTAVQLFTGSPRQWHHPPLAPAEIDSFLKAKDETGITFTCAHDSYLINLAAPDPFVLERSMHAFRGELDRAHQLGIPWVVTHMGAHLDQGEAAAVSLLIQNLRRILDETDAEGYQVGIALETTAGQGTGLGWRFEQLGEVVQGVGDHPRLGVCLDTCHVFVAGYDLRTPEAYEQTLAAFDAQVGLNRLKIIHANDAKKPLGSRVDRHEHIGAGEIGLEAFARLVVDARLLQIPIILETPDSQTMHEVNLRLLRSLASRAVGEIVVFVQLFGHYTDFVAEGALQLNLPAESTITDLARLLEQRDSRLNCLGANCRFAVKEEYAPPDTVLCDGTTVAILPPVSGG